MKLPFAAKENKEKLPAATEEDMLKALNSIYQACLNGLPTSPSVEVMAQDYLKKHKTAEGACKDMMNNQVIKCTASGFLTGLGGLITLPVAIPANVGSVLYVQMRMIACAAYMGGYDTNCDQTQTFVYACLAGVAIDNLVKQVGIKVGVKVANNLIEKIPGKTLIAINKKVGFRLLTKFGEKGIINFGKMIPLVGGVVGGGFDLVETKVIAHRAYKWFIQSDFSD